LRSVIFELFSALIYCDTKQRLLSVLFVYRPYSDRAAPWHKRGIVFSMASAVKSCMVLLDYFTQLMLSGFHRKIFCIISRTI